MKILVTGGAGFIASHIVDSYLNEGHQVFVIDNLYSGKMENVNPGAKFIRMDIRSPEIQKIFEDERFDVVNHHAAQMDVRKSVEDPLFDADVNISGSLNLLESSLKTGVKKFIFASTGGAIYGEQDYFPADEKHPCRPVSPYGIAKYTVENYLFYYKVVHGLEYIALRYSNVYGPRQNPHGEAGVVAIFCERMLTGKEAIINGDGDQTRDFVFVEDVVAANLKALNYGKSGIFNIGTALETSVNQLFRILRDEIEPTIPEKHGPAKPGEQLRSVIDYGLAREKLGWTPRVSLEEGLKKTIAYFRQKIKGK